MDILTDLQTRVTRHLQKTGETPTAFGLKVLNNPSLVPRILKGNVTAATMQTVSDYLAKQSKKSGKAA